MKTTNLIRTLAVLLVFLSLPFLSANALKPALTPPQQLEKALSDAITYPAQAVKNCCQGSADIIFTVNEDGKINIKKILADSPNIEKMVRDQISGVCCKGINVPAFQYYKVKITFKLIG